MCSPVLTRNRPIYTLVGIKTIVIYGEKLMFLHRFYLLLISLSLSLSHTILPMEQVADTTQSVAQLEDVGGTKRQIQQSTHDSDSEDEEGYTYHGLPEVVIPDDKDGTTCIALARGIHFSPSKFTRSERSHMRRVNDAGQEIFSSAAYDLANEPFNSQKKEKIKQKAIKIRNQIKHLKFQSRNVFQKIYSNQYDGFHKRLGTNSDGGIFKQFESDKNPQVSTSEDFVHAGKYASGHKFLGTGVESLDPEYDASGKPKHPYLGKLFAILVSSDQIDEIDPYFVVHGHANDYITISNHFSKNVLIEREVSIPGLITGDCVLFSVPLRVPSFQGEYKPWYMQKFGISKRSYLSRQKLLAAGNKDTVKTLLMDVILPHCAKKMKEEIAKACAEKNITLVYKQLDGSFGQSLPSLVNASDYRKRIKDNK